MSPQLPATGTIEVINSRDRKIVFTHEIPRMVKGKALVSGEEGKKQIEEQLGAPLEVLESSVRHAPVVDKINFVVEAADSHKTRDRVNLALLRVPMVT